MVCAMKTRTLLRATVGGRAGGPECAARRQSA